MIRSNILVLRWANFASLLGAVLGLATRGVVSGCLIGLRTDETGFMRDELYPMPIAGGDPEAVVEIVVARTVDGWVDGVVVVGGGLFFWVRLDGRISSSPFISRISGGTGYTGYSSGGLLSVILSRLRISCTSWKF